MIRLRDVATIETYSPPDAEGVVFRFRRITNSENLRATLYTRDADGKLDDARACVQRVATALVSIEGLADAEGNQLAWPEKLADRVTVVEAFRPAWVLSLNYEIVKTAQEADASGKG